MHDYTLLLYFSLQLCMYKDSWLFFEKINFLNSLPTGHPNRSNLKKKIFQQFQHEYNTRSNFFLKKKHSNNSNMSTI